MQLFNDSMSILKMQWLMTKDVSQIHLQNTKR